MAGGVFATGFFGALGKAAQDAAERHRADEQKQKDAQAKIYWDAINSGESSPEQIQYAQAQLQKLYGGGKPIKELFGKLGQAVGIGHKVVAAHTGQGQGDQGAAAPSPTGGAPVPPSMQTQGAPAASPASPPAGAAPGAASVPGGAPTPPSMAATPAAPPAKAPPTFADMVALGHPSSAKQDARKLELYRQQAIIDRDVKIAEEQANPIHGRVNAAAKPNVLYSKSGEPYAIERPGADGKIGIYTPEDLEFTAADQRALDAASKAQKAGEDVKTAAAVAKAPYNIASELHKEHPDWTPEKIQQVITAGKQTGLGTYAMVRLLDFAAKYDPSLLSAIPAILKKAGVNLPAGIELPKVPPGMPTDASGNPIGLGMPGAPTGQTRSRGQLADGMLNEIPRIKAEIAQDADLLGPLSGRWNEFIAGKVGGDPDDPNYGRYQALRTDMLLLSSGAAKMHLNSVRAVDEFNRLAATGKMTPDVLDNFVRTVETWATTYAKQGRGQPLGKPKGAPTPPSMSDQSSIDDEIMHAIPH